MNQPVPKASDTDVMRIVTRDFMPSEIADALLALEEYGKKDWHREIMRVRIATLKLAGGSLEKLREAIRTADQDYRDVLSFAEYPGYFQNISPTEKDETKRSAAIDADWKNYTHWFEKK